MYFEDCSTLEELSEKRQELLEEIQREYNDRVRKMRHRFVTDERKELSKRSLTQYLDFSARKQYGLGNVQKGETNSIIFEDNMIRL